MDSITNGSIEDVLQSVREPDVELILAIAGDRYYSDYAMFSKVLQDELERFPATMIVTGDCTGTDTLAYTYAVMHDIPIRVYCASVINFTRLKREGVDTVLASDWDRDGHAAGPIRNRKMLEVANRALLFDGGGKGSRSVRKLAKEMGKDLEAWEIAQLTGLGTQLAAVAINAEEVSL